MKFMALGGTNYVGASCYYLELSGQRFLLDCGKGFLGKKLRLPTFDTLLYQNIIMSIGQIDAVFLSHAHFDHIAALPELSNKIVNTPIYATGLTKELGDWLLWDDFSIRQNSIRQFNKNFNSELIFDRISTVSFYRPFNFHGIRITFYPAGHVPGAAMILFEAVEGSFLYTGDFSSKESQLTVPYNLPQNLHADALLLCGLHAKHPFHSSINTMAHLLPKITSKLKHYHSVYISICQLTKGLELVRFLLKNLPAGIPLWIDEDTWSLACALSRQNMPLLNTYCNKEDFMGGDGIHIGPACNKYICSAVVDIDFSLHAEYNDCSRLIRELSPHTVFVVHSPDDSNPINNTSLYREFSNIEVIYPKQNELYATA